MRCQFLASERHNLDDNLFLIEPRFISFDGESLLNALLYGPDEFNDKINEEIILRIIPNTADNTGLAEEGHGPPLFYVAKIKKGNKEKKERVSK